MSLSSCFHVVQAYAALDPPPFPLLLSVEHVHDCVVNDILSDTHLNTYPPSAEYMRSFYKWIISVFEQQDIEIDSAIYERYLSLISFVCPSSSSPQLQQHFSRRPAACHVVVHAPEPSYVTYFWPSGSGLPENERVTVLESRTTIQDGTTGLRTWPASFVLADYLLFNPDLVSGTRVMELGCGIGLLSCVVSLIQTRLSTQNDSSIHLTDHNQTVLAQCRDNCQLPCSQLRPTFLAIFY